MAQYDRDAYRIENSDIQFYNRAAFVYQVILLSSPRLYESLLHCSESSPRRLLKPARYRMIYRALHTVLEYQYGCQYSYPASNEAEARMMADEYAMISICNHWYNKNGCQDLSVWRSHSGYAFGATPPTRLASHTFLSASFLTSSPLTAYPLASESRYEARRVLGDSSRAEPVRLRLSELPKTQALRSIDRYRNSS